MTLTFRTYQELWKNPLWTSLGTSLAGLLAAYALVDTLDLPLLTMVLPTLAISIYTQRAYSERMAEKNSYLEEMSKLHLSTIECLAKAIDAKDQTTHGHIRRVQFLAVELGKLVGLSENDLNGLQAAALLHDIGKLAVPESILNKPGKLSKCEYSTMKLHTLIGAEILSQVDFPYPVVPAVRYHHERYDGKGYPEGLQGEKIPLLARILTLADFYDALRSDRPYRLALPKQEVIEIIHSEKGKMFDPQLADLFCEHVSEFEMLLTQQPDLGGHDHREFFCALEEEAIIPAADPTASQAVPDQADRVHQEVFTLYEMAQDRGSRLDLDDTLAVVANKFSRLVPVTTCVIYLNDPERDEIAARQVNGPNSDLFRGLRLRRDQGLTGWALTSRRMIANSDPSFDLGKVLPDLRESYRSATSLPLVENDQSFGAITLYCDHPNAFNNDHLRLLEIVMAPVARAIADAMARQRARHRSLVDPITGLGNLQYLHLQGEEELDRARRHGYPLAVLAMDLDGFERVNNAYGTHIGDRLLHEIGDRIRLQLRPGTLLSRTTEDSFVAILPDFSPDRAATTAAGIQAVVAAHPMRLPGDDTIQMGISIGSAHFPADGRRLEDLLLRADRRLIPGSGFQMLGAGNEGCQFLGHTRTDKLSHA